MLTFIWGVRSKKKLTNMLFDLKTYMVIAVSRYIYNG